jgi:enoyl-CoA hydratase
VELRTVAAGSVLGLVRLNRPESLNPLDHDTIRGLRRAVAQLATRDDVCAIAFTGAGRAFSAGGDMQRYRDVLTREREFAALVADFHELVADLANLPKLTIALVNGVTAAGGLELLLACDIAVAAESARIGDLHQKYGLLGGGGVLGGLLRVVGQARAYDLVFSCRLLSASDAERWGLVSRVVPDEELMAVADDIAREVAARSPLAVARSKALMRRIVHEGIGSGPALELEGALSVAYTTGSGDAREGIAAFAEHRTPRFTGR